MMIVLFTQCEESFAEQLLDQRCEGSLKPMMVIHHLESLEEFEVSVTNFSNIVARITEYDTDIPLYNSPENGIYAIDEGNQIIHRLYTENMIPQHRRYNSVLFKIM